MSPVSDDDLSWILQLLDSEGLVEVEVEEDDWKVRAGRAVAAPPEAPCAAPPPATTCGAEDLGPDIVPILSPIAGIIYWAPSPESPPYVEEGGQVERGGVVGLIETMKVFNEVEAPVGGTIVKILVDSKQNVQADQRIMLVRVAGTCE
jgi:acetyl-CoA carboxylase biotin carboxyl carrier protein